MDCTGCSLYWYAECGSSPAGTTQNRSDHGTVLARPPPVRPRPGRLPVRCPPPRRPPALPPPARERRLERRCSCVLEPRGPARPELGLVLGSGRLLRRPPVPPPAGPNRGLLETGRGRAGPGIG